ncbi:MAG: hypothetical protein KKH98_11830 [Spirochaetes bacterium]|nr:hypothetical protein [Spirochaetota bacterium]
MTDDYSVIGTHLLHDSVFEYLKWDRNKNSNFLTLVWDDCIRLNLDGSEINDLHMSIRMSDITGIAFGIKRYDDFKQPSAMDPPGEPDLSLIKKGIYVGGGILLFNDRDTCDDVKGSLQYKVFFGEEDAILHASVTGVFSVHGELLGAGKEYQVLFMAGCRELIFYDAARQPIDLALWEKQNTFWWQKWEEASRDNYRVESKKGMIPAAKPEEDHDHQPPKEDAYNLSPNDLPPDISEPLKEWFEKNIDRDHEDDGRWAYARAVDSWWQEDGYAVVVLRGIEHSAPIGEFPANNVETVWSFALWKRHDNWVVTSLKQGWPPYHSAPAIPGSEKSWLSEWTSGPVLSEPEDTD